MALKKLISAGVEVTNFAKLRHTEGFTNVNAFIQLCLTSTLFCKKSQNRCTLMCMLDSGAIVSSVRTRHVCRLFLFLPRATKAFAFFSTSCRSGAIS
jgi:hypothetical protein